MNQEKKNFLLNRPQKPKTKSKEKWQKKIKQKGNKNMFGKTDSVKL